MWESQHGSICCAGPDSLIWMLADLPETVAVDVRATGATVYTDDLNSQASLAIAHRLAFAVAMALALAVGRNPDSPPFLNRSVLAAG